MITLVTGGTGLVGNNVVRLLVERGDSVRVLARAGNDLTSLAGLPVEVVRGNVQVKPSVEAAFQDVGRVVHCAAQVHIGWQHADQHRAINVEGTRNVAETALQAGARMVHVSSVDALGVSSLEHASDEDTPPNGEVPCPYVVTKRAAEKVVLDAVGQGLNAVIVNPGFMLGPWDWKPSSGRVLLKTATGWGVLAPPGANSYCDVRDVAAGILAAMKKGRAGQRYILAGQTLTHMEALRIFARITGQREPLRVARRVTVKAVGCLGDLLAWATGHESDVNSACTAMSMLPKSFSSARAAAELGYGTRDMEQSASDAWEWLKEYGYTKA